MFSVEVSRFLLRMYSLRASSLSKTVRNRELHESNSKNC